MVSAKGYEVASRANVLQLPDVRSDAQQWAIEENGSGCLLVNKASEKALDVTGKNMESGTNNWMYDLNYFTAQTWVLSEVVPAQDGATCSIYSIINSKATANVSGNPKAAGANVQVSSFTGDISEKWMVHCV